jgi:signal transduction histidine kinase
MSNPRKTFWLLNVLGMYILLQLCWWGYLLIRTSDTSMHDVSIHPKPAMIVGEGLVFLCLLGVGFWYIRKNIRQELRLARMEQTFLLSVTHELKTPISAIKLFLSTLKSRKLSEGQIKEIIDNAIVESDRLQNLTENILLATRMDQESGSMHIQELNFSELVSNQMDRWQRSHGQKRTFSTNIRPHIQIHGDANLLNSLLNNLVDNAVKYSGENGNIRVALDRDEVSVMLTISDNGPGISDEEKELVFEKFYRVGNESTRIHKGTGLGLHLVRSIARLHDASVQIKKNQPQGLIVEVIFAQNP